jgi:hypothetical protein
MAVIVLLSIVIGPAIRFDRVSVEKLDGTKRCLVTLTVGRVKCLGARAVDDPRQISDLACNHLIDQLRPLVGERSPVIGDEVRDGGGTECIKRRGDIEDGRADGCRRLPGLFRPRANAGRYMSQMTECCVVGRKPQGKRLTARGTCGAQSEREDSPERCHGAVDQTDIHTTAV